MSWHGTEARRKEGISVIYQELSLFSELTVGENVYINNYPKKGGKIDWKKVYEDTQKLADSLNIRIDAKARIADLNIGQRQLTEIMKAIACNAKLIVMDEPSSTLSKNEFQILVQVIQDLKAKGITIIYISHHLEELFLVGDRITVLRDGRFVTCKGTHELDENTLVEYMTGVTMSQGQQEERKLHKVSDEVVLELKDLCNHKVNHVSFQLHKGEVLGLYGLVGSGRTEILQSIFGVVPPSSGEIYLHGKPVTFKCTKDAKTASAWRRRAGKPRVWCRRFRFGRTCPWWRFGNSVWEVNSTISVFSRNVTPTKSASGSRRRMCTP